MNFLLSEEQLEIQRTVERLLDEQCPSTTLHQIFDAAPYERPQVDALWQALVEMGIPGLALPEEYGGSELELIDLALVSEVLGSRAAPTPFFSHSLSSLAILWAGSDEQKSRWLPTLASGEHMAAAALGEDLGVWEPMQWRLKLEQGHKLTGAKYHAPDLAQADFIVVGLEGGKLAVVERDAPGLTIELEAGHDRTRPLYTVYFENTPAEPLEDPKGNASKLLHNAASVLIAADAFGGANHCVEMAVDYAKIREQFGVPIGRFQALKHQLANMALAVEPSRGLYWFAAHAFDHLPDQAERAAALAKAHLTDLYLQVARDSVEAHGGIGYTWECDVQIYLKRAMYDHALFGNPRQHRERAAQLAGW